MWKCKEVDNPKNNYLEFRVYHVDKNKGGVRLRENKEKDLHNLATTKRKLKELLRLNINQNSCMLTLTYKENMQDYNQAHKDLVKFIKRLNYKVYGTKKNNIKYLAVKELQKRGAIHYHMVIFSKEVTDLKTKDIKKIWTLGKQVIKKDIEFDIDAPDRISNYLAKYLVNMKKGQLIESGKKLYDCSKNLIRVQERELDLDSKGMDLIIENSAVCVDGFGMKKCLYVKN